MTGKCNTKKINVGHCKLRGKIRIQKFQMYVYVIMLTHTFAIV